MRDEILTCFRAEKNTLKCVSAVRETNVSTSTGSRIAEDHNVLCVPCFRLSKECRQMSARTGNVFFFDLLCPAYPCTRGHLPHGFEFFNRFVFRHAGADSAHFSSSNVG